MSFAPFHPGKQRRGIALVVVLALIVLLTFLVVAYLSQATFSRQISTSSAGQMEARQLAATGAQLIVHDLRQEIAAGSKPRAAGKPGYLPASRRTSVPFRMVEEGSRDNLLKASLDGIALFGGSDYDTANHPPILEASKVSTASASANRRSVDPARWSRPALVPGTVATPDWVILTRGGPKRFANFDDDLSNKPDLANASYAIGRFAFTVYDTGGLIDINAAGYPTGMAADDVARKGPLAFADLTRIPGISGAGAVNDFVSWRNTASATPTAYRAWALDPSHGFLTVAQGDQALLSRQDLLAYQSAHPETFGPEALPFLSIFSRSVNGPVYQPATDMRPEYEAQAETASAINRNLPNVCFKAEATLTRYRLDGRPEAVSVRAGDPLISTRFPLHRLAWLGSNGIRAPGSADAVRRHFGLRWDAAGHQWVYTSPDAGNTATGVIKTLEQVADAGREPDFFELLKAGILNGSLGQVGVTNPGDGGSRTMEMDEDPDIQIMRIGAAIIDQYDADSYPSAIEFGSLNSLGSGGYEDKVFGIENTPFINRIYIYNHRLRDETKKPTSSVAVLYAIEVWNPHQNAREPARDADGAVIPIRVAASGTVNCVVQGGDTVDARSDTAAESGPRSFSPASDYLEFVPTEQLIRPMRLIPNNATAIQSSDPKTALAATTGNAANIVSEPGATNPCHFAGFVFRTFTAIPDRFLTEDPDDKYWNRITVAPSPYLSIELEYRDETGTWRPYHFMRLQQTFVVDDYLSYESGELKTKGCFLNNNASFRWQNDAGPGGFWAVMDPRTTRFGLPRSDGRSGPMRDTLRNDVADKADNTGDAFEGKWCKYLWPTTGSKPSAWAATVSGPSSTPVIWKAMFHALSDNRRTSLNGLPANSCYYQDPDGVVRPGDGYLGAYPYFSNVEYASSALGAAKLDNPPPKPLILNRPFRSVGELGYVFRDMPWKTLDFSSPFSADAGLLDLFSCDENEVVAAKVNLNTCHAEVIEAILAGALKGERADLNNNTQELDAREAVSYLDAETEAQRLAQALVAHTGSTEEDEGPMLTAADFVTRLSTTTATDSADELFPDRIKTRREAAIRALAEATQARTWNFLIDVIAQSGRYPPSAKTLESFVVEGECRVWLHVAIDRYSGKVIDSMIEPVNE